MIYYIILIMVKFGENFYTYILIYYIVLVRNKIEKLKGTAFKRSEI